MLRAKDMILMFLYGLEMFLELLDIPHTPKNISKPYKNIKIISLALSTL